jgi:dimethylhistidine N-methyltransferase
MQAATHLASAHHPSTFAAALLAGLQHTPRQVSPKWFYDQRGSELFEQICELPEYYPTRTELGLLTRYAHEMVECMGPHIDLIEFGAGATRKVRHLLDASKHIKRFIPIDISAEHLTDASNDLREDYPMVRIEPMAADFMQHLTLPEAVGQRIGFFPGSSIGNFDPAEAQGLLTRMAKWLQGGGLLIGVDLVKDPATLHAAYNDAQGVTAQFNLNLLARANTELGTHFRLDQFAHSAFYNPPLQRIEMHLVSLCDQTVPLAGERLHFQEGSSIHTESSYKYTVAGFQALASRAGFRPDTVWLDEARQFSLHWLSAPAN